MFGEGRRHRGVAVATRSLIAIGLALGLFVTATGLPTPAAAAARTPLKPVTFDLEAFANVELPGDLGQSELAVYVPETKHSIRGYMLDYWRANGAASVYGYPISEPFASEDGRYSQAFENGVFQFYPELVWTDLPSIKLMPIGWPAMKSRLDDMRPDGRRGGGGGDRRHAQWSWIPPDSQAAARAEAEGGIYVAETGHTIRGPFYDWYASHEGYAYLGNPLSQPVAERGVVVQYFEGGMLMRLSDGSVRLAPLAREMADELGIDTEPVARTGLPTYDELLFWTMDNPNPIGDPYAPGRKWIEVNVSQQMLYAYQGDTLITQTLVSTGIAPNTTELGVFHVRYKVPVTDMQGTTGPNGEVIAVGTEATGGERYIVEDVPDVMYINADAEALHGAYWHNNFGTPMSHGCINLPLNMARFLYGWAPLGTMVWVHE